jgi:hypothetical protein
MSLGAVGDLMLDLATIEATESKCIGKS